MWMASQLLVFEAIAGHFHREASLGQSLRLKGILETWIKNRFGAVLL